MRKVFLATIFTVGTLVFVACGNEAPKTDLSEQEQATVDSTINLDNAASDSLEAAIRAQIETDQEADSTENHEGHNH